VAGLWRRYWRQIAVYLLLAGYILAVYSLGYWVGAHQ
jgi:hypothetical protein